MALFGDHAFGSMTILQLRNLLEDAYGNPGHYSQVSDQPWVAGKDVNLSLNAQHMHQANCKHCWKGVQL